jgi:phage baseplate assembly protein W
MHLPQLDPARAFLGVGWAYPIQHPPGAALAMVAYEEDIRQAIRIILGTNRGERVMRPDFGAGLNDFVFEPMSTTTLVLVETRVRSALIDREARIDVEEVTVRPDPAERLGKLLINIRYRVRATNAQHNLVYPFYLQEGTAQ